MTVSVFVLVLVRMFDIVSLVVAMTMLVRRVPFRSDHRRAEAIAQESAGKHQDDDAGRNAEPRNLRSASACKLRVSEVSSRTCGAVRMRTSSLTFSRNGCDGGSGLCALRTSNDPRSVCGWKAARRTVNSPLSTLWAGFPVKVSSASTVELTPSG